MNVVLVLLALLLFSATPLLAQTQVQSEPQDISDLRKAAEQGDAQKQFELGDRYYYGKGVAKDHAEAMKLYCKAAEQGDPEKQFRVGFMYWLDQNNVEAFKWYRRSAEQGNLLAEENLAGLYKEGKGVPQDYGEAAKWYRKAVDNSTVEKNGSIPTKALSEENLGALYERGLGVPQDYAEAAKLYRSAVGLGYGGAAFSMYFLCAAGKGTGRDCADAAEWLSILVNQDNSIFLPSSSRSTASIRYYLGTLYEKGLGVSQDYAEAAKWYRKSSDQGNPNAQLSLSGLYVLGRGVPQDFVAAHMWLNLAASGQTGAGSQEIVAKIRDNLAATMTPQQIAEAQRLAREWKPITTK